MPKYDAAFTVEYVIEVEAEDTEAADLAARRVLRDAGDLGGPWQLVKILRTDPPLSLAARSDAGLDVEQPAAGDAPELPRALKPVDCSLVRK
jgi:hypothetical protein